MARARIFTLLYFFIHWQASNGQQCSVTANSLAHQQVAQNNLQNPNQNFDSVNFNTQLQQSARQSTSPQQSLNMQQLSNIPMQTFNVQQPGNIQQQGGAQSVNCQPVNQAINLQQVPQHINMKQDVPQQTLPNSVNLQQAAVVPINSQLSPNVNIVQQSAGLQQSPPGQGFNLQQQSYTLNSQQPTQVQGVHFQQQTSPQSISLQQPVVVQPVNVQQQIMPQDNNLHQQPMHHSRSLHLQSAPIVANLQQAQSTPILLQQSPIVQPLNYQQSTTNYDLTDLISLQPNQPSPSSLLLQTQTSKQLPREQNDIQQQIPYNSHGGYQVVSYQKPCQQSEVTPNLPVALQLSSNSNPAVITAVPVSLSNFNAPKQSSDNMYILTPQNYLSSSSYSPIVVSENQQPTFSTSAIVPITTVTNTVPSTFTNLVNKNNNQPPEMTEYWTSSLRMPDIGMLTGFQEQFPIASLLQSTSPVQSALLSSILSSFQSPSTASQYVMSSNYPAQTILSPQSSSQSSKLSLKCLLPLLLDLIQEKYTNHGCQCNCCNCQCSSNCNNFPEPQITKECLNETEEKRTEVSLEKNEESDELEEIVNPRQRNKVNNNRNVIPVDSTETEDTENSTCEDDEDGYRVTEESDEENDTDNTS